MPSASLTAVPVAPSHAATCTVGNHPLAGRHDHQQQQPSGQQTSDSSAAAFPTSAGSSPQVHVHSYRRQGPISLGTPMRNPPLRSTAAINIRVGSSATAGAGNLAHAPAPLQPAQGLRPSASPPRSPLSGRPSPSPAPPHAAVAPNSNTGSSAVRAASSNTSPNITETRAAANSPWSVNHLVAAARARASSVLLPGFLASFLTSAAHSSDSEPLPDTAYPEQAGTSQQTGILLSLLIDLLAFFLSLTAILLPTCCIILSFHLPYHLACDTCFFSGPILISFLWNCALFCLTP